MLTPESYAELVNRIYRRSQSDGYRSYPIAAYEIFMLTQAQQRADQKEAHLFRQLGDIFDWNISRQQLNAYLKKLKSGCTLILTDLSKTILWTSRNFLTLTGYSQPEVIGQTAGILQGPDTSQETITQMRESLRRANAVKADLLNYRKNGETYMCHIQIDPLYNSQGNLTHFLAVENELLESNR